MSGRYHVDGDMSLFIRMNEFFAAGADPADVMELGDARPNRRPDSTPTPPAAGSGSRSARPAYGRGPLRFSVGVWMTIAFLPWTILWTASGFGSPPWSGYAALGTAALIGLYHVATNRMTLFEIGTLAYCAVHVALAGLGITLYVRYAVVFQHLFLAALWTGSLTRRFCLTAEYVRFEFPAVALRTAAFLDTNRILTAAWSIYYMVAGALHFVAATAPGASRAGLLVFALLVPMFGFNSWFQRWYPARLMARAPAGA